MVMVGYRASNSVIAVSNPWSLLGRRISGWARRGSAFSLRAGSDCSRTRRTVSRLILSVLAHVWGKTTAVRRVDPCFHRAGDRRRRNSVVTL